MRLYDDIPEQKDSWSCGVYTCAFIQVLAQGGQPIGSEGFTFTAADAADYRSQMMQAHLNDKSSVTTDEVVILQTPAITYEPPSSPSPASATPTPQSPVSPCPEPVMLTPESMVSRAEVPQKRPAVSGEDDLLPSKRPLLDVAPSPQTPSLPSGTPSVVQNKRQRTASHESQMSSTNTRITSMLQTKRQRTASHESQMSNANSNQSNISTRSGRQRKLTEKAESLVDGDGNWIEGNVRSVKRGKDS
ncbi:hypothetical protein FRC03_005661 [Tulasnella sp. 419]|nr:hypothetical protein FRC03_005661 [Tulasnella sp. 419]